MANFEYLATRKQVSEYCLLLEGLLNDYEKLPDTMEAQRTQFSPRQEEFRQALRPFCDEGLVPQIAKSEPHFYNIVANANHLYIYCLTHGIFEPRSEDEAEPNFLVATEVRETTLPPAPPYEITGTGTLVFMRELRQWLLTEAEKLWGELGAPELWPDNYDGSFPGNLTWASGISILDNMRFVVGSHKQTRGILQRFSDAQTLRNRWQGLMDDKSQEWDSATMCAARAAVLNAGRGLLRGILEPRKQPGTHVVVGNMRDVMGAIMDALGEFDPSENTPEDDAEDFS